MVLYGFYSPIKRQIRRSKKSYKPSSIIDRHLTTDVFRHLVVIHKSLCEMQKKNSRNIVDRGSYFSRHRSCYISVISLMKNQQGRTSFLDIRHVVIEEVEVNT